LTAKPQREYPGRIRFAARLTGKLDKTLAAYASAATAVGVGILALTYPAEAKIVYTHIHKQIPFNKTFFLDLNHDGITEFGFNNTKATTSAGGWDFLTIFPTKSANRIWGDKTGIVFFRYASALAAGVQVGPNRQFTPGNKLMVHSSASGGRLRPPSSYNCNGPWKNVSNRYLGLKFLIKGNMHYGWARLNATCSNLTVTATLTGYAYETTPNKPIITGKTKGPDVITVQPASLGHLARGASAIPVRRGGDCARRTRSFM
jgi:hypothetical protein